MIGSSCLSFVGMLFLRKDEGEISIYILLIGLGSLLWITPYLRSLSVEVAGRTDNPRERYLVTNFMRVVREVLTGVTFVAVGILMERGTSI